jgi:hypothetical protein
MKSLLLSWRGEDSCLALYETQNKLALGTLMITKL